MIKLILGILGLTDILYHQKIAKPIRELFGIEHFNGIPSSYPETFFGDLFKCFRCLSVWVAGALVVVSLFSEKLYNVLLMVFGASYAAFHVFDTLIPLFQNLRHKTR